MKKSRRRGDFPIPRSIRLPGLLVRVKIGSPEELSALGKPDGAWLEDDTVSSILLDGSNPIELQRYTLLHELQHAMVDLLDGMLEDYPEHIKTRRMVDATPRETNPDQSSEG